ncbi:C type lectin receptor A [Salmo salar]|uniref:C type lectin receptor A n=1 Tax=Salmo salar TaxID=8030 RepID=Q68S98_SALSA|nr:C type lectin receptor A [Salmo salar]AAT77220.1 C type lectin receptor A [Salmo salar]|eukprot:NP_001117051.1 C type lectin receptor A [Salmo salar]
MEKVENYTSLHEFTEDISSRGNKPILNNQNTQGLKGGSECLRGQTALFVLIGLLASICANIALSVLLFSRPLPSVPLEAAALTLKLNSVRGRYVRLCDDYSKLGQSCSKTVRKCRECPEDWIHVDEKCYSFSNDKMDWPSSRDSCTSLGSHLTILHSKEQHDALEKEARRIGGFDYHFWIGLSDIEKEGDWRWVDNTTLTNKYWNEHSSEPDNHQSGGSHGEDCATLDSHSLTWFDVPCDNIYKRICQMDAIRLD